MVCLNNSYWISGGDLFYFYSQNWKKIIAPKEKIEAGLRLTDHASQIFSFLPFEVGWVFLVLWALYWDQFTTGKNKENMTETQNVESFLLSVNFAYSKTA